MDIFRLETLMTIESQVTDSLATRDILTVSQLNQAVSRLLEKSFVSTWVRGEISNFTQAASGHWYFTLKDDAASVRAVMFRSRAAAIGFVPRSGESVELRGKVTLYEARGEYQLQVESMRRAGLGSLYEAFVQLKNKLAAEGLFDASNKRDIPQHPRAIGVVTSLGAAALRDVLTAMARRAPHVPIVIYPAMVQGSEAPLQLRKALALANDRQEVDTILLVRGGGSLEDLWSFNDESLARDIASSLIPVVSGVGHETDFTIADFVADLRAPTPTAAAELVCATRQALLEQVSRCFGMMQNHFNRQIERLSQRVDLAAGAIVSPAQRLAHQFERLTGLGYRLIHAWQRQSSLRSTRFDRSFASLGRLLPSLDASKARLERNATAMILAQANQKSRLVARFELAEAQLRALSPENTLARGYAIVRNQAGDIVKHSGQVQAGQLIHIKLGEGELDASVLSDTMQ